MARTYVLFAAWTGPENVESRIVGVFFELSQALSKAKQWAPNIDAKRWELIVEAAEVDPDANPFAIDLAGTGPCEIAVRASST